MKKWIVFLSLFLVFILPQSVLANSGPQIAPFAGVPFLIPLTMLFLSLVGGAYPVLKRIRGGKTSSMEVFGAVVAYVGFFGLLFTVNEWVVTIFTSLFGIFALVRGIQMIRWGWRARSEHSRPVHLTEAQPLRLIPAGVLLIPMTLFLMGMSVSFAGYWPESREEHLTRFVAYQLAYAKIEDARTGERRFHGIRKDDRKFCELLGRACGRSFINVEYGADRKSFTLYMLSSRKWPFFPYNYITSQPSYRADGTGQIRMVYVHNGERCPADAPVVLQVPHDMVKAIADGDQNIKRSVVDALTYIKNPVAVEPLIAALKDRDWYVRWRAAGALRRITGQDFGDDADAWQEWWEQNKTHAHKGT